MKKTKYFLFSLICMFCCSIVFAKDEVVIKSITPVYDENSGVIVTEENGVHSVIFNDKDQSVKYNVVIENTTSKDIPIDNIELPKSPEDFLKYELTGLNNGDVLKADSTKEVVISLETVKTEGWGRNFDVELTTNIDIDSSVINPNTSAKDLIVILILAAFITGSIIVICKKIKL